jgi:hypothetical protein
VALSVTFNASDKVTEQQSTALTITTSDPSEKWIQIGLTGAYSADQPAVSVATPVSTQLVFAAQAVGTQSPSQQVELKVTKSQNPLLFSTSFAGPNAGDFAIQSSTCPSSNATLNTGQSCTLNVVFTPSQSGPRAALLTINDNSGASLLTVMLTGVGAALYYGYGYGVYEGIGAELI